MNILGQKTSQCFVTLLLFVLHLDLHCFSIKNWMAQHLTLNYLVGEFDLKILISEMTPIFWVIPVFDLLILLINGFCVMYSFKNINVYSLFPQIYEH